QGLLDLGPRTTCGSNVNRVDAVDAVGDKGAFTPAYDLPARADAAWQLANRIVVVDEGIEDLGAGGLGALLAVGVADVLEAATFVFQFEVVPVLATHEHT